MLFLFSMIQAASYKRSNKNYLDQRCCDNKCRMHLFLEDSESSDEPEKCEKWLIKKEAELFLRNLRNYLKVNYDVVWNCKFNEVFSVLFRHFGDDVSLRTMCLAYMIHGTSGFTEMESYGREKYKSRGFLQISTKDNYEKISTTKLDYSKKPDMLAKFDVNSMNAALYMFDHLTKNSKVDFANIVYKLRPSDTEAYTIGCKKHDLIYETRMDIYLVLCKIFKVRPVRGTRKFYE
ncbi:hypothetical protein DMUE_2702 [Dictyocoela muelleri]|nr:hypothetical protein DMUE_2702 [Dictyocoela muelleri]